MSFISEIDHNDFFENFTHYTDFKLLSNSETTSLIFPKSHPIIRNLQHSLDKIAVEITKNTKNEKDEYFSKKQNLAFLEMMEATFSSEMPKSTRNRTPFADVTDCELFKSNKPKLPKAPKNLKKVKSGKKNFVKDFENFQEFENFKGNLDERNFDENDENKVRGRGGKKKSYSFSGIRNIDNGEKFELADPKDEKKNEKVLLKKFLKKKSENLHNMEKFQNMQNTGNSKNFGISQNLEKIQIFNFSKIQKKRNIGHPSKKRNKSMMNNHEIQLELSLQKSKNEFKNYKSQKINRSSDDSFFNFSQNFNIKNLNFSNRELSKNHKFGLKLKNFLKNKISVKNEKISEEKFEELNARKMKSRLEILKKNEKKVKKSDIRENRVKAQKDEKKENFEKKNEKSSFQQFMKKTKKNKNGLIKSLRQRICVEKILSMRRNSRSKSKSKEKINIENLQKLQKIKNLEKKFQNSKITKNLQKNSKSQKPKISKNPLKNENFKNPTIPRIPIKELSKRYLREQITNGRVFNENNSKTSTDELKTVKRKTRDQYEELLTVEMTKEKKSNNSSLAKKKIFIGNCKTKDNRIDGFLHDFKPKMDESCSENNLRKIKNCLNSSEFLRSQLIRAKGYEIDEIFENEKSQNFLKKVEKKIFEDDNGKSEIFCEENCEKKNFVKENLKKKFHLNFNTITNMNIKSIYSQEKSSKVKEKNSKKNSFEDSSCAGQPRITRNFEAKGDKKIKFPKFEKNENLEKMKKIAKKKNFQKNERKNNFENFQEKKNFEEDKENEDKKRYYSVSRRMIAERVARKLVEFGRDERRNRHKKSSSLSRSFGIFGGSGNAAFKRKSVDYGVVSKG